MLIYGKEIRENVKEQFKQAAQDNQMAMTIIQVGKRVLPRLILMV